MENKSTIQVNQALTCNRGVQFALANGYTVSFQFGTGNYCDNRGMDITEDNAPPCSCVEMGIYATPQNEEDDSPWIRISKHDDVAAFVAVDDIPQILVAAQASDWDAIRDIYNGTREEQMNA